MDLIPRYLQAVRFWLPKKQQDDIIAELSQDISDQVAEQESRIGRPLNELEIETLLRQRGSPLKVATGFLPQQHLIGPTLFPVYRFVLIVVTGCLLIPVLFGWIVGILAAIVHGPGPGIWENGVTIVVSHFWTAWFASMGVVTLVFAILERSPAKTELFEKWNPRKLPPLRDPHAIPRSSSVIEIVVNLAILSWWITNMMSGFTFSIGALTITLAHAWVWFWWSAPLLMIGSAGVSTFNLLHPYWTRARIAARLCLDWFGSVFFCWFLKANLIARIAWPHATPDKAALINSQINLWLARMFPYAVAVCLLIFASNVWRFYRLRSKSGTRPMHAAVA
jgi:hypothetical protein